MHTYIHTCMHAYIDRYTYIHTYRNLAVFSILFWNFMIINNIYMYHLFTLNGGPEIR